MLAALFFLGTSVAAVSVAGFGVMDGEGAREDDAQKGALPETSRGLEDGQEASGDGLGSDRFRDAPSAIEPLGSDGSFMVSDAGETSWDWSGIGGNGQSVPHGDPADVPDEPPLETTDAPEASTDGFEAVEVHGWVSSDAPVEFAAFDPAEEILHVTLFAPPDAEAVDVELAASADGLDGEIRANGQVLARVRGLPGISSDTVRFALADLPA